MNDRELVQSLRDDADRLEREAGDSCLHADTIRNQRAAAARLDRLRWRGVDEGLPDDHTSIEFVLDNAEVRCGARMGKWWCALDDVRVHASRVTHWRYVDPPGAEGGGA